MLDSQSSISSGIRKHGPVLFFFLVIVMAGLSNTGLIVTDYFDDMFVVMDLVWRSSLGQMPHVDFHSPIGPTFYWPFAVVTAFFEPSALTLLHANLIVALCLLMLAMATLPQRLSGVLYFAAVSAIILTAVAPRDLDWAFNDYTHLAPYNRWGWSLIMLATLISTVPRGSSARTLHIVIDGFALGSILALLLYLKINFFFAALGMAIVGLILRQIRLPVLLGACATLALIVAAVALVLGNNLAYLRDISSALQANVEDLGSASRIAQLRISVLVGALYLVMLAGVLWAWRPTLSIVAWSRFWWKTLLICCAIVLAGAVLGTQNHNEFELALYVTAVLVAVELAKRKLSLPETELPPSFAGGTAGFTMRSLRRISWIPIVLAAGFMPILDATSVVAHAFESRSSSVCPLPGLRGTTGEKLLVLKPILGGGRADLSRSGGPLRFVAARSGSLDPADEAPCLTSPEAFVRAPAKELLALQAQQLVAGKMLIDQSEVPGGAILALNFTNPYPALLRTTPPSGSLIWWDRRTFSARSYPDARQLIGSSGAVLQGRTTDMGPGTLTNTSLANSSAMWPIYGRQISQEFKRIAQNEFWMMWIRHGESETSTFAARSSPAGRGSSRGPVAR